MMMQSFEQLARPFVMFYLTLLWTSATAKEPTVTTRNDATTNTPFPRIYVATILTPDADPSTVTRFPAEVDLLDFDRITETTSKISFMVHNEEDLSRLSKLARTPKTKTIGRTIEIDIEATEVLRSQIEFKNDGEMGTTMTQSSTVYAKIPNYPCYKSLLGSFAWMNDMVTKAAAINGLNVTKSDIGNSYLKTKSATSGYDIWALVITGNAAVPVAKKGIFFMMSGLHARELAPPELSSRWIETLINGYGNNADITSMLDSTEIHLVLQANPDGRQVAETNPSAMRRKNMNPGGTSSSCSTNQRGVDLNRNFPYQWGLNTGSSSNPCSETYRGKSAGSEPEVQAIINYTKAIFPAAQRKTNAQVAYAENSTIGVFLDIHAYGNLILPNW
jgi:carboxypeptidase T